MIGARIELSPTVTIEVDVTEGAKPMRNQIALIEAVAFWQALPSACPMPGCGAPLHFQARHPKTFHYYSLVCEGPKTHECLFGLREDETSLFLKEWKDAYSGGDEEGGGSAVPTQAKTSPIGGQKSEPSITKETVAELMRTAAQKQQNALEYAKALGYSVVGINALTEAQGKDVVESLKML